MIPNKISGTILQLLLQCICPFLLRNTWPPIQFPLFPEETNTQLNLISASCMWLVQRVKYVFFIFSLSRFHFLSQNYPSLLLHSSSICCGTSNLNSILILSVCYPAVGHRVIQHPEGLFLRLGFSSSNPALFEMLD